MNFIEESVVTGALEPVCFGEVKYTFSSDYSNTGNGVSFALRLGKSSDSYTEGYPAAPNNKYRCAYRYEEWA